jgi:hypothetical protein
MGDKIFYGIRYALLFQVSIVNGSGARSKISNAKPSGKLGSSAQQRRII